LFAQNIPSLHVLENEGWILFPFQLLNPETYSVQGDITWGGLLSNNLRWLNADRMLTLQGDAVMKQSKFVPLGEVGNGAGDPTSLRIFNDGKFAVTLGGIDSVAVGRLGKSEIEQIPVGLHPIGSVFSSDGKQLFVINEFCDSVSRIDLDTGRVDDLQLGPLREPTLVERGERLFFHSKLSHDGWMSCHSCHSQGHTSGQLNDNTSDGSLGSPKRILSLLGQAETAPYSWGGDIAELEQQVLNSLQSTMATDFQIARGTVDAIAAYVRSLPPPPSVQAARRELISAERLAQGRELFEQLSCSSCHAGSTLTSAGRYDVNLRDEVGLTEFNPPSLIGVSQRSRSLLHDGRATSIEDVIVKYQHQLPRELDRTEVALLVDYLRSL
jgi:mono/diheme cytochrome c family protein